MKTHRLRTRIALSLSLLMLVATLLPMLFFYLLGMSNLLEITYVTESQDTQQITGTTSLPAAEAEQSPDTSSQLLLDDRVVQDPSLAIAKVDPVTGDRIPLAFDPSLGRWIAVIPPSIQRVVFTSPLFMFRADLPAWLALGALPIFSLLIGILMSIWLSRSVTQPVSELAQAVNAVGKRDLGFRVETKGSQELQDLAQSFNRMADELEQAEHTRHNLMADIAHELRTPLTVLEGNLRAMLDGIHVMNEEEIALLYEQTHHLKRLVDDLRLLSLAEADQLSLDCQEVDLVQLVRDTVAHFTILAQEKSIQLNTQLEEPLTHPCLDDHRMRQVLHNLLSNSIKYTPTGGIVTVSGRMCQDKNILEIAVADSGVGIKPQELPYIFDRFNRTREERNSEHGGTGLGLAIVKAIVEAQGGRVSAQSAGENRGSTFTIYLPMH